VHYDNGIWLRKRVPKGLSSRRTWLIMDPPDGQVPFRRRTPSNAVAAREARQLPSAFDGFETRPLED